MYNKKRDRFLADARYLHIPKIKLTIGLGQKLRMAALVACSFSNLLGPATALAENAGVSVRITITARVMERTAMTILNQSRELVVTKADISRGYVDAPFATRINVNSNNPAGYLLSFEVINGGESFFNSVSVFVHGREVHLSSKGGCWIPRPYIRGGLTEDLDYRFILANNAEPGTYPWPVIVSVQPI